MTEQKKNQPAESSLSEAKGAAQRKVKKRREVLIGSVVAVCLIVVGAGLFHHFIDSNKTTGQSTAAEADAGLIDWQQVIEAHPDYQQLKTLQDECKTLELETQSVDDLFKVSPPDGNPKPFEDAVWQKNAHDVIGGKVELERKANKIRAEYTKATEAEFQARIKAVDDEYLNAILNLNLRLDNQAAMHNPLDSKQDIAAEQAGWEQERQQLQQERGARQQELYRARQQDIAAHVRSVLGPELAAWQKSLPQTRTEQESDAVRKQSEADARNTDIAAQQMDMAQKVQQRLEKRQQLADKRSAMAALEAHILNDVAGKAAKIAILHHFTLILVDHPRTLSSFDQKLDTIDPLHAKSSIAVGVKTIDVTDELVQEMASLSGTAENSP